MEKQTYNSSNGAPPHKAPPDRRRGGTSGKKRKKRPAGANGRYAPSKKTVQGSQSKGESMRSSAAKRKKKKKRRDFFPFVTLIVMIIAVIGIFAAAMLLDIESLEVKNPASYYSTEDILDVAKISTGDSMLVVNPKKTERAIVSHFPYVRRVSVTRNWPHGLYVDIEYAELIFALRNGGTYVYMDADGKVLDVDVTRPADNVAIVNGIEATDSEVGKMIQIKPIVPETTILPNCFTTEPQTEDPDAKPKKKKEVKTEDTSTTAEVPENCRGETQLKRFLELISCFERIGIKELTAVNIEKSYMVTVEIDHRIDINFGSLNTVAEKTDLAKKVIEEYYTPGARDAFIIDLSVESVAGVRKNHNAAENSSPTTEPEGDMYDGEGTSVPSDGDADSAYLNDGEGGIYDYDGDDSSYPE